MFWCECIIVGFAFWICVDVACAIHITIVTHKYTSEQIHHHCHTVLPALTLLAILPLQLDCSHAHTQEHGTLTHPRNELGIRKSWGGLAATHTMSYYCEDEDITDPGKIALKILRGRKRGPEAPQRVRDVRCRQEEAWQNMGVAWVSANDRSQLQSASSPLDGLQAKMWGICQWLCNQSTHSSPQVWIWREWIGGKDHWTHDCIHTNRRIPAWTAGKSQRLQADRRTCRGETFWSHSLRSTGNSETHKHTTEQCGPSRPKEDVQQRGDTKSDGKQHREAGKGSRRRDRRFHDLQPAASYTSDEDSTEPYDCIRISSVRSEVFTTLDAICPRKKGMRKIKLKVDTGAAGNTLPLRTCKQMYKTLPLGHNSRCTRHSP